MESPAVDASKKLAELEMELANFRSMMKYVNSIPNDVSLANIEAFGATFPLNGELGGDHIVFVDFKRRYNLDGRILNAERCGLEKVARHLNACKNKVGMLLADVSGHSTTDALLAAMLHQGFLTGVLYELETQGRVTGKLFEILNTRFHRSSSVTKFITMIYGEIAENGTFKFISAGHPKPLIFSAEFDRFVEIEPERLKNFLAVGMFPSEDDIDEPILPRPLHYKQRYTVNEVNLMGQGDILLLQTDGLAEHADGDQLYVPHRLEEIIRQVKSLSPREIVAAVHNDMVRFATPKDDISLVVIKKNQ